MKTLLLVSLLFSVSSAFAKAALSFIFEPNVGYELFKYSITTGDAGNEIENSYEKQAGVRA